MEIAVAVEATVAAVEAMAAAGASAVVVAAVVTVWVAWVLVSLIASLRGKLYELTSNVLCNVSSTGLRNIQWDLAKLPKFEKNFYIEHPDVRRRPDEEADRWRQKHSITVNGKGVPKPVYTFEEASMPEYVLQEVLKQGFDKPTPIQSQGWPMALLGRDMVGISATGSGKTLAFLLPAMIHINAQVLKHSLLP